MFLLLLLFLGALFGVAVTGMTSFVLLFTRRRRSWIVPVFALPSFLIGGFYTVGYWLADYRQPDAPFFWGLLLLGAFSIVGWLRVRSPAA